LAKAAVLLTVQSIEHSESLSVGRNSVYSLQVYSEIRRFLAELDSPNDKQLDLIYKHVMWLLYFAQDFDKLNEFIAENRLQKSDAFLASIVQVYVLFINQENNDKSDDEVMEEAHESGVGFDQLFIGGNRLAEPVKNERELSKLDAIKEELKSYLIDSEYDMKSAFDSYTREKHLHLYHQTELEKKLKSNYYLALFYQYKVKDYSRALSHYIALLKFYHRKSYTSYAEIFASVNELLSNQSRHFKLFARNFYYVIYHFLYMVCVQNRRESFSSINENDYIVFLNKLDSKHQAFEYEGSKKLKRLFQVLIYSEKLKAYCEKYYQQKLNGSVDNDFVSKKFLRYVNESMVQELEDANHRFVIDQHNFYIFYYLDAKKKVCSSKYFYYFRSNQSHNSIACNSDVFFTKHELN
jgi:hypothetical protein